LQNNKKLK